MNTNAVIISTLTINRDRFASRMLLGAERGAHLHPAPKKRAFGRISLPNMRLTCGALNFTRADGFAPTA